MNHIIPALLMQIAVGALTGQWWYAAALPCALFIGREHACAEYRWIEQYGMGRRANMPWYGGFDARVWTTRDQWLDWIGPIVATMALALIMEVAA